MYKIEAIIRPEKLEEVKHELDKHGFYGITISEIRGSGRQKGIKLQWRAGEYTVDLLEKIKIELVVKEEKEVNELTDIICDKAGTGNIGDGKIFIYPLKDVIRIRTRERGKDAI